MLKKHERFFRFLQQLSDALAITSAWLISYYIRFIILTGGQKGLGLFYLELTPLIVLFTIFFFYKNNLYTSNRYLSWHREILSVFYSTLQGAFLFIIIFFFAAPSILSRITLGIYIIMSIITTIIVRSITRNFIKVLRSKGKNQRQIILVGHGESIQNYIEAISNIKGSGLHISHWIDSDNLSGTYGIPEVTFKKYNKNESIKADAIIIGYSSKDSKKVDIAMAETHKYLAPVFILPDIKYTFIGNKIEDFEGIPMIKMNASHLSFIDILLKRILDIIGSFMGLILLSPIYLIIALLVKFTSKGPIFYGQERMSLDGEKFKMWKFRSMRIDAEEESGAVWTVENDDRRTPIGSFLRSSSIDELPQLWNVFIGDMSLIGPRPERPVFVEQFKDEIPAYMTRHKMKAGITGWAQANGWRGNTSLTKRIEFDIYYIKNWSLFFDFKILLLTIVKGFINKNAY